MTKSKVPSNRGISPNHVVFGPYGGRDAVEEADLKHEAIEDGDEIIDPPPFDATSEEFTPVQQAMAGFFVDAALQADAMYPDDHLKASVELAQRSDANPLLQMSLVSIGAQYAINSVRVRRGCAGFGDRGFGDVVDERSDEDRKAASLRVSQKIGFDQPKREIAATDAEAMRPRPVFDDTRHIWQPYDKNNS